MRKLRKKPGRKFKQTYLEHIREEIATWPEWKKRMLHVYDYKEPERKKA